MLTVLFCPVTVVAANSKKMAISKDSRGLDMGDLSDLLNNEDALSFDLDAITNVIESDINPLRVVVDCTNSEQVADYYERWLSMGVSVISPGRRVGSGDLDRYCRIRKAEREHSTSLCLESSVGNALPIIGTLHDLKETGDDIRTISGSLSGTMAFVLSTFSDEVPFSQALRKAQSKEISEKDLRLDLSGTDMAQKVVTLAREGGLKVRLEDVEVESLLPEEISSKTYDKDEELFKDIEKYLDGPMLERMKVAEKDGRRLRYKFDIDFETGTCRCFLDTVTNTDPLFRLKKNENLVAFDTSRYESSPLIVKGSSAGPDLSAAGIFADLLRLTRAYASNK
jgi:bifunctional aspartokinase / homoserine dehydrogenase 1